jgi:hypothetical protein
VDAAREAVVAPAENAGAPRSAASPAVERPCFASKARSFSSARLIRFCAASSLMPKRVAASLRRILCQVGFLALGAPPPFPQHLQRFESRRSSEPSGEDRLAVERCRLARQTEKDVLHDIPGEIRITHLPESRGEHETFIALR